DRINNRLLEFDCRATSCADIPPEWDGNVAVDVYGLTGKGDKIARTYTSLRGDEQSPRTCLKNCYADNVADAETNVFRAAPIRKFGDEPGHRLPQDARDLGRDPDKGIWDATRVVLPGPHVPARGAARRHQRAAPRRNQR